MTNHKIYFGDACNMNAICNSSVHLIVTSPPYWQLKDYGSENQIGYNDTYDYYINNLNLVWQECLRVLHNGCRLCINIGDQFARSVYYGRYKIIPIRDEIIRFCETIGFDFMGSIIWQKVTTCNTSGGASIMGSFPYPRNGIVKMDYEYILLFKKPGEAPKVEKEIKEKARMTNEEWNEYFNGHWYFSGAKQDKHLAMFPEELPKRLIRMFSFDGETVLDPFLGSGTTSLSALKLERNSIGYEINKAFKGIIEDKISEGITLDKNAEIEFFETNTLEVGDREFKKLPYIFSDPIKLNKLIDPKKLSFGSKIDVKSEKNQKSFMVKNILSPNIIELSSGLKVCLLGVKPKSGFEENAVEYLKNKVLGQRITLKFDKVKHFDNEIVIAYVYLLNKTFVNMHLLRTGLVNSDNSRDYIKKAQFMNIECNERTMFSEGWQNNGYY